MLAILIPSKSSSKWTVQQSLILDTVNSIANTKDLDCKVFIGYDKGDKFYENVECTNVLKSLLDIEFFEMDIAPGHLTKMWNFLASKAITFDYLYMCGDDIIFTTIGWMSESIKKLQEHNNLGMTGPADTNNRRLLTQCMVHKTHIDIFGFLLPEELKNWYCDDWINDIYPKLRIDFMYTCKNSGGPERYKVAHMKNVYLKLVERDRKIIQSQTLNQSQDNKNTSGLSGDT